MNPSKSERITLILEIVAIFIVAFSLWYKVFLPETYFVAIIFFITLLVVQMLRNKGSKFLVFQIALIFLLIRNVYYISTNYSIIPFGDGNWDYGVAKTFTQNHSIFVIQEPNPPATLLTWYSGWPLLHTLAVCVSQISGIDIFYVALLLPSIISITSLIFVYLFVEKIRTPLKLDARVTALALLMYATLPEGLFWPMQFVRQNFGILLLTIIFYLIYVLTINPHSVRCKVWFNRGSRPLVMAHHFTSFSMVLYLFLFCAFLAIGRHFAKTKVGSKLFWSSPDLSIIGVAFATLGFLFVWWNNFGAIIWPTVGSGVRRLIEILMGIGQIEYLPARAFYPNLLTPMWVTSLLALRDILAYIPALFGLFHIMMRASKTPQKFLVTYSTLAFGALFIIDSFIFRVEIYRIITLSLPFIVLLSATFWIHVQNKLKSIWRIPITVSVVTLLLSSSFIGLWAHNFAPLHLYDTSINSAEVGERNSYSMRLITFSNERLSTGNFKIIWADDLNPLLLLDPGDYGKIQRVSRDHIQRIGYYGNEIIYEFKSFNLYFYYAGTFSPAKNPENAQVLMYELKHQVESKFNCAYNDGKCRLWTMPLAAE